MRKLNFNKRNFVLVSALILSSHFMLGQDETTLKEQEKIAERANNLVYEGNELLESDKFIPAEMEYRRAISKHESNVAGNYNLGTSYYEKGNMDESLFRLTEAITVAKNKSEKHKTYHNIGNLLMKQERCEEAVEAYKNALRNDPTDDETRYNFVLAKECAENQKDQQNDKNNKDKDKDKEEENKDEEKDGDNQNEQNQEDQEKKDKDNQDGENENENDGKPKDEEDKKEEQGDGKDEKEQPQKPKQQPGQLSPQQIKSLLEAMNNQEQKVQEKMNAEKRKGAAAKTDKDW